jgi:site-specific DNA-cytosine methylase
MTKLTALVLFAGSGGLSLGLHQAGFAELGLDFDPLCVEDHRRLAGPAECVNLEELQPHELRALWAKHYGEDHPGPDLLATSPPCKGFSGCLPTALAEQDKYQRMCGLSLRGVWLALEAFPRRPKLFILENVPRMGSRGKAWLAQIVATLQAYGYATHLDSHDCGEIGGLAQVRRRLLLVARHRPQVSDLSPWPKPPKKKHKAIRDVLANLPIPLMREEVKATGKSGKQRKRYVKTWDGGPLHRPVGCSMLTWLRLALVPEGKDWRSIPKRVTIHHAHHRSAAPQPSAEVALQPNLGPRAHNGPWGVEGWDGAAHTVTGQGSHVTSHWSATADVRTGDGAGAHPGARGVQDWEKPAHTVIGGQRVERNYGNIEVPVGDGWTLAPGLPDNAQRHAGGYGVVSPDAPSPTITGGRLNAHPVTVAQEVSSAAQEVTSGAQEVDPQLPFRAGRQFSQFGVNASDGPAHAVVGVSKVDTSWASFAQEVTSVADVGLGCEPRRGVYGVSDGDAPAPTVIGSAQHDNGAWTMADARIKEGPHTRSGNTGVEDWDAPSHTVKGVLTTSNGCGSLADPRVEVDPRMTCAVREGAMGVSSWEERFRTAVISRGIPQNGPWQIADARGLPVPVDGYVVGDEVWLRPGFALDLKSKKPAQVILLTWNEGKRRWAWHRPLTTMELAALQGLPVRGEDGAWLELAGGNHEVWREHIGNMVPAPTARAIGQAAMRCLTSGGWLLMGPDETVWVDGEQDDGEPMEAQGAPMGFLDGEPLGLACEGVIQ